jgi:hypothetical protein
MSDPEAPSSTIGTGGASALRVEIPDPAHLHALLGQHDENLKTIERATGARLHVSGGGI